MSTNGAGRRRPDDRRLPLISSRGPRRARAGQFGLGGAARSCYPGCSPGPADCGAWHTANVTVSWAAPPPGVTASGCGPTTITSDTGGTPVLALVRRYRTRPRRHLRRGRIRPRGDRIGRPRPGQQRLVQPPGLDRVLGRRRDLGIASCTSATDSGPDTGGRSTAAASTTRGIGPGSASSSSTTRPHPAFRRSRTDRRTPTGGPAALSRFHSWARMRCQESTRAPPRSYRGPDARKASLPAHARAKPPTRALR